MGVGWTTFFGWHKSMEMCAFHTGCDDILMLGQFKFHMYDIYFSSMFLQKK